MAEGDGLCNRVNGKNKGTNKTETYPIKRIPEKRETEAK